MAEDWDRLLEKRGAACRLCERAFEDDEVVTTTLRLEGEGFQRRDLCAECAAKEAQDPWSVWQGQRFASARRGPMKFDLGYLRQLFVRLVAREDENARPLLWVVALLLMRRRLLELQGRRLAGETEVLLCRLKGEEETLEVHDPHLDESSIQGLAEALGEIFELDRQKQRQKRPQGPSASPEAPPAGTAGEDPPAADSPS